MYKWTPLYTAHLQSKYKPVSMQKLQVVYNDYNYNFIKTTTMLQSCRNVCFGAGLDTLQALLRHLIYAFSQRLDTFLHFFTFEILLLVVLFLYDCRF